MKQLVKRVCRACRTLKDRDDMFKITKTKSGIIINPDSKMVGRSVYVCKNEDCIKKFIKTKGLKKGLKLSDSKEIEQIELKLLSC